MKIAFTDTEISKISRISPRLGEYWGVQGEFWDWVSIQRLKIHRGSILTC